MRSRAAAVGHSLVQSLDHLFSQDLCTQRVESVYGIVLDCVTTVDQAMRVYMFGSTAVYGVHEKGSDVDFVALTQADVSDGRGGDASTELAKALQADFLRKLAEVIRQKHYAWNVEEVRRTRVPVLRVKGGSEVDFDITASRRNGVRNSALLRAYFEQSPQCRVLSMALKRWSKRAGVNAAVEGGSITSYGFNLMVVYYFLRRGKLQFVPPASIDVAGVAPMPSYLPLVRPANDGLDLGEEVLDFLHFYLHEFDAKSQVVSLSRPEITTKEQLGWTKAAEDHARMHGEKIYYQWCIEDPYEINLNVGRNVTPLKLIFLRKHMERAVETALLTTV